MFFEKGAFIIPFTGEDSKDIKITAILIDYNQSIEIEENKITNIPAYILLEQIEVNVYKLNEVKLAQHKNPVSVGEICFLELSRKSGFLSFELLFDNVIPEKLNNDDFNLLTHAGAMTLYATFYKTAAFYTFYSDFKYRISTAVREFVANGGAFIGSCYGANVAGSGHEVGPITIHYKRASYNPNLHTLGFYSIADYVGTPPPGKLFYIQIKIVNNSHPLTFNLDEITWDLHMGGSGFDRVGKNT